MKTLSCKAMFVVLGLGAALALSGCIPDAVEGTDGAVDGNAGDGGMTCHDGEVLVCHVPPGNPANAHEICIGQSAVSTHLERHGDWLGSCSPEDGGVDADDDGGADGGVGDGGAEDGGAEDGGGEPGDDAS